MNIQYSKSFKSQYKKSPKFIQEKFKERVDLLLIDKFNTILNNHSLSGDLSRNRSINISGDWRAIFEEFDDTIRFKVLGKHSQLYR
jgi:addiction module RelE/StbE family toxin